MVVLWVLGSVAILVGYHLYRINAAMSDTPPEAKEFSPKRWTEEEIKQAYAKAEKSPPDFTPQIPPKVERRYIVTGGSGLVGGQIVLQLLARGQSPESIRIVDFRKPQREDMQQSPASDVDFTQADVANVESVAAAFSKPWSPSVADLPLTVFHTVAIIRPHERSKLVYDRCYRVNVEGTKNVVHAAKAAGCDVFIATSSGSISIRPVQYRVPLWKYWPERYFQVFDESDAYEPLREHDQYFANYAVSKAEAERFVMTEGTNSDSFLTGCIRPANGIYGNKYDQTIGAYLDAEVVPTWIVHGVQQFVHASNVAIAHLLYESALLSPHRANLTGRTFIVTDPSPPMVFGDMYNLVGALAITPFRIQVLAPLPLLLVAHCIEAYCLALVRFPRIANFLGLREPPGDLASLQPSLWPICTHLVASDRAARKPVADGGLGYVGAYSTLELMADEVRVWNNEHRDEISRLGARRNDGKTAALRREIMNIGTAGAAVKA